MLTENQISKLEPLTLHPKFGRLLKDAIEIWKLEDVSPGHGYIGIELCSTEVYCLDNKKCCCLIGAALIGKKKMEWSSYSTVEKNYNLTNTEVDSLWKSFDGWDLDEEDKIIYAINLDAWEFAQTVRQIVNPIHYDNK